MTDGKGRAVPAFTMALGFVSGFGPGAARLTSCPGSGTGRARSRIVLNIEKIAALAPMPRPSDSTATTVTKGVRQRVRRASFRFGMLSV